MLVRGSGALRGGARAALRALCTRGEGASAEASTSASVSSLGGAGEGAGEGAAAREAGHAHAHAHAHSFPAPPRVDRSPVTGEDARRRALLARMLRVDHAGEYGAVRIYQGQLAVLGRSADAPLLHEMQEHERVHLAKFQQLLPDYRVRPTALLPLWSVAGYALGAGSALLGRESAMAVTQAVEEVIMDHYNDQIRELRDSGLADEEELRAVFRTFRDEEQGHHDVAVANDADKAPFHAALTAVVKAGCTAAIRVSERL